MYPNKLFFLDWNYLCACLCLYFYCGDQLFSQAKTEDILMLKGVYNSKAVLCYKGQLQGIEEKGCGDACLHAQHVEHDFRLQQ